MADPTIRIMVQAVTNAAERALRRTRETVEETGEAAERAGGGFEALEEKWKKIVATGASVAGAFVALKKAYDFGKEGAAILQTSESFDRLMDSMGVAPDILGRLREASLDTVDDMTIMSSTMTLLAGTSDTLGYNLAESTPRLMEIARAAHKLNPMLGDTAFLYESLAEGIKRASPMILDNLGLTIKVGDAQAAYAEKLGKSVEELTAEEQQIALLNAALEAGDRLIQQVGGSTEEMGDSFAQSETKLKNTADELKTRLVPAVTDAVDEFNRFLLVVGGGLPDELAKTASAGMDAGKSFRQLAEEARKAKAMAIYGGPAQEEAKLFWIDMSDKVKLAADEFVKLGLATGSTWEEMVALADAMDIDLDVDAWAMYAGEILHVNEAIEPWIEREREAKIATEELTKEIIAEQHAMELARQATDNLWPGFDKAAEASDRAAEAYRKGAIAAETLADQERNAAQAADDFGGSLDLLHEAITGEVGEEYEDYIANVEELDRALADGEITRKEYKSSIDELTEAFHENNRALAFNIAEKQILDALEKGLIEDVNKSGTAYDEANKMLWDLAEGLGLTDEATIQFMGSVQDATQAMIDGEITSGQYADTVEVIAGRAGTVRGSLKEMADEIRNLPEFKQIIIDYQTHYSSTGSPPPVPGAQGAPGQAYQHGGQFTVRGPSGPDRVPVAFRATAGEVVTITPAGWPAPPSPVGGATNNYNLTINTSAQAESALSDFHTMRALAGA